MKYCLLFIMIFYGTSINKVSCSDKSYEAFTPGYIDLQEDPFYFLNPVPVKIRLPGSVDLSFFRNQLIVTQFRYRLEVPNRVETIIDRNLINWSPWINFDLTPVTIPKLDQEGLYSLIIEYKTQSGGETKKYEKLFYAYKIYFLTNTSAPNYIAPPGNVVNKKETTPVTNVPDTKTKTKPTPEITSKTIPAPDNITEVNKEKGEKKGDLTDFRLKVDIIPEVASQAGHSPVELSDKTGVILTGEGTYVRSLIDQWADINLKNNPDLSPLHLAVLLNQEDIVNELISKGAKINMKGNAGYTPLHIAAQLNYLNIANKLLHGGADIGIKTNQGLSPGTIARIQNNNEMIKLIRHKGADTLNPQKSVSITSFIKINPEKQIPSIDFNLAYDNELAKRRQFNKTIQIISVPLFAASAAGAIYMRSEANRYYSLSKVAETEDIAKIYYDKTRQYDTKTYVSGGISLVSSYLFIHSTLRKRSISQKMHKTYN